MRLLPSFLIVVLGGALASPAAMAGAPRAVASTAAHPSAAPARSTHASRAPAAANGEAEADAAFLAARDAFVANDRARFDAAAARLQGHTLQPYVEYWSIRMRLDSADAAAVRAFVRRNEGTPVGDRAHVDWLKALGRRQDWTSFAEWLPAPTVDDVELQCFLLQHRGVQKPGDGLRDARALWFVGRELPDSCEPLFEQLLARGELSRDDVWARFRLASEAGRTRLAARLNDRLPESERISGKALDLATASPLKVLARPDLKPSSRASRELALFALGRAARDAPTAAREQWLRVRATMPREDRLYGNALLAHVAARRHMPEALAWYREAEGASMSDEVLAWKARAALRERSWKDVVSAVEAMTPAGRGEVAWRYWHARAQKELGQRAASEAALAELAREPNFYGLLSAEDVGQPVSLVSEPLDVSDEALATFAARPGVRRMLKLYEVDMRPEALQEWICLIRGAGDPELLVAAEFARRQQIWDRAINTAERTKARHDWSLRFLAPYRDVLGAAARQNGLDEALVLGLVRQESRFRADIVSSAGAVGLMQLMPATAKWVARQLGRDDYRPSQISRVDLNAEFGSFYLRHVLDRLEGLPVLATAAYNAGPGRAQAWRGSVPLEGAIYAESIPFNETRDYVKKVLANSVLYAQHLGLQRVPLRQLLGVVPPRGGDAVAASSAVPAAAAPAAAATASVPAARAPAAAPSAAAPDGAASVPAVREGAVAVPVSAEAQ